MNSSRGVGSRCVTVAVPTVPSEWRWGQGKVGGGQEKVPEKERILEQNNTCLLHAVPSLHANIIFHFFPSPSFLLHFQSVFYLGITNRKNLLKALLY